MISKNVQIRDMVGKVFTEVQHDKDYEKLQFVCEEGTFIFYHAQDCCESVRIEDITGDLINLVGTPLILAEISVNTDAYNAVDDYDDVSRTWTFYKFATIKGYVDVRWLGESNGYYSEEVDLEFIPKRKN